MLFGARVSAKCMTFHAPGLQTRSNALRSYEAMGRMSQINGTSLQSSLVLSVVFSPESDLDCIAPVDALRLEKP